MPALYEQQIIENELQMRWFSLYFQHSTAFLENVFFSVKNAFFFLCKLLSLGIWKKRNYRSNAVN